ncbi:hypothetical protein OCAR_5801 [Afipia carboxidovorans OM5]|nr:hypothetical protein OCAR_5801 [Afipia carboxidovorans OM5]
MDFRFGGDPRSPLQAFRHFTPPIRESQRAPPDTKMASRRLVRDAVSHVA